MLLGKISIPPVTNQSHYDPFVQGLGQFQRRINCPARADSCEYALLLGQFLCHFHCFLLRDIDDLIHSFGFEYFRGVLLGPSPDTRDPGSLFGLHPHNFDVRVLLLQILAHAHNGAGGAHG